MSPGCGFATNPTVPEMRRVPGYIPRCTNFRQPVVRIALPAVNRSGVLRRSNRKGCDLRPLMDWRFHLPFGPEAFWVLLALSEETR